MSEAHTLGTATLGRYLVEPALEAGLDAPLLLAFHGYSQNAEHLMEELRRIPGAARWTLVSVQALHRFYHPKTREVVGSWMTSLDREQAIEDNVAYVGRVIAALRSEGRTGPLAFLGYSQGAAMAWRAAARCGASIGLVVLGGDLPADVAKAAELALPPILIGRGDEDPFYSAAQLEQDLGTLAARGLQPDVLRYAGGHAWSDAFREAAGRFLDRALG